MPPAALLVVSFAAGIAAQKAACFPLPFLVAVSAVLLLASLLAVPRRTAFALLVLVLTVSLGMTAFGTGKGRGSSFEPPGFVSSIRDHFVSAPGDILPEPYSGLLGSMVLGSGASPPPESVKENFTRTGTVHLLVASGLHLSILTGFLISLFRLLGLPGRWGAAAALLFAFGYVLITGAHPSIIRAFFMVSMAVMADILGRENDPLSSLSLAALLLLAVDPNNLFRVGFQLSFAATAGLLYLAPILEKNLSLGTPLSISLAPYLMTMPIILFNFSRLSIVAPLVNILIAPWIGIVMIMGFCSVVFAPLGRIISFALLPALAAMNWLVGFFSRLPFASINLKAPSILLVSGYYAGLIWLSLKVRSGRFKLNSGHFLVLALFIVSVFVWSPANDPNELAVSVIDVGQGDSIFIESPSGRNMLIDCGTAYAGRKAVVPFLRKKGVNELDLVVITHSHSDHAGGFPLVEREFRVENVLMSGIGRVGEAIDLGGGAVAGILGPLEASSNENDNSIILRLSYGSFSMLFVGDLERGGEEKLISGGAAIKSDVLKVGHHGSGTSSTAAFLRRVMPSVSIISVGGKNRFGHPSEKALERLRSVGSRIFRTDLDGTVVVRTDGKTFSVATGRRPRPFSVSR